MALRTPPSWLQNGSHPAENDRLTTQAIWKTTGIINATDLQITQNGGGNMSVNVSSGYAAIVGTTQTNMGTYMAFNDASTNLTISTSSPSNPRIDLVVVTINDAYYTGTLNNVSFQVIAGTPAASPTVPATPANSLALGQIAVGTSVTSILTANITNYGTLATGPFGNVTTTGTQTLTNKSLSDSTTFIADASDATKKLNIDVTGTTGITGTLTSAFTTAKTLTLPDATDTLVGRATNDTLTNKFFQAPNEVVQIIGTGFAGYTFDVLSGAVVYITANSTANGTLNFRGNGSTTLTSVLAVGQSVSCVLAITNSTAFYPNAFQVDGSAVTPKWSGGTAPSAGNASAIDAYTFTIIKTAATPTYTVLAGGAVKFA